LILDAPITSSLALFDIFVLAAGSIAEVGYPDHGSTGIRGWITSADPLASTAISARATHATAVIRIAHSAKAPPRAREVPIKRGSRPRASCADGLPGPRSGPGEPMRVASVILDGMSAASEGHWERVYETRSTDEVSWFQAEPSVSRRLVEAAVGTNGSVVDVGAGASRLVDLLLDDGFADLTVLDVSARALAVVRERLAGRSSAVTWVHGDVLDWHPGRSFDVWHDRAVFHFLTDPEDRSRYVDLVQRVVHPGGTVIVATFAADGPTHCSGLPVSRSDAAGLATVFGEAFMLGHAEREEHLTPSGALQPFTWAVLHRR
jgi:ubiquinone/menaquinone biosynthesis C-methylase UbiE